MMPLPISHGRIEKKALKTKGKGINLVEIFGQHYAITAGLDNTIGDWIVVMDCSLQDQPSENHKIIQ